MGPTRTGRPHSYASLSSPQPSRPPRSSQGRAACGARGRRRGQVIKMPTRGLRGLTAPPRLVGGRHGACEAWLRCPWAVAGPGSQEREPAATHSPDQSSRHRLCSGHRMACPPARRPRRELRSARRLEARPGPAGPAAPSTRATLAQYIVVALHACQLGLRTNEAATGFPATASSMNERQREISATSTRAVTAATHTIAMLRPTARISSRSISYSTSNHGGFRLASISTFTRSPPRTPTGSGLDLAFRRASSCPSAYGKAPAPFR